MGYLKINNIETLKKISLVLNLPQVGSYEISYEFNDTKIHIDEKYVNKEIDFIISSQSGTLKLGHAHSKLANKQPVFFAGTLKINEQGKIESISNDSGHYMPQKKELAFVIKQMKNTGCIAENLELKHIDWDLK